MFYGAVVWDPWLIVAQIVCLQCLYYVTLGLVFALLVGTRVSRMSLFYFFDFAAVSASTVTGWCVIASFLLTSIAGTALFMKRDSKETTICFEGILVWCMMSKEEARLAYKLDLEKLLAGYLLYVVERAKKCLDFSATICIIHLFICVVYGGWPSSFTWWTVNVGGLAIMALLGEYLCIRRELREIPITRFRPSKQITVIYI
ncbi:Protein SYS1-like protein [Bienertia sinuspersici]